MFPINFVSVLVLLFSSLFAFQPFVLLQSGVTAGVVIQAGRLLYIEELVIRITVDLSYKYACAVLHIALGCRTNLAANREACGQLPLGTW